MGSDVTFPLIALTRARTHVRAHRENPSLPIILSLWGCWPAVPATDLRDRYGGFGAGLLGSLLIRGTHLRASQPDVSRRD